MRNNHISIDEVVEKYNFYFLAVGDKVIIRDETNSYNGEIALVESINMRLNGLEVEVIVHNDARTIVRLGLGDVRIIGQSV